MIMQIHCNINNQMKKLRYRSELNSWLITVKAADFAQLQFAME